MVKTYLSASELASAFPSSLRQDALAACATFPAVRALGQSFSVHLHDQRVTVPCRWYLDTDFIHLDPLTALQRDIVDCLLTRHSDGFTRQRHLERIVGASHDWTPPLVVQLAGEYVAEILDVIYPSRPLLDKASHKEFLCPNPAYLELTEQRVISDWDCYYRNIRRDNYGGFKILEFFRSLSAQSD
jgi:hypothetical protein